MHYQPLLAYADCRKSRTQGMWPSHKCSKTCVYKAFQQPIVFGDCPANVGNSCPKSGACMRGWLCGEAHNPQFGRNLCTPGHFLCPRRLLLPLHQRQGLPRCAVALLPDAYVSGAVTMLLEAGATIAAYTMHYTGCRPTSSGPMPAVDCQAQCIYAFNQASIPDKCEPGVGIATR